MSEELPVIVAEIPQEITGSNPESPRFPVTAQLIGFHAYKGGEEVNTVALAGQGSPTLIGGWAKIAEIPRFQRVSVTVPEGYDPYKLSIPIMFDSTVVPNAKSVEELHNRYRLGAQQVEKRIKALEWMAGRKQHPDNEIAGEPPYVEVFTYQQGAHGFTRTNLVPTQYQSIKQSGRGDQSEVWRAILKANPKLGNNPDKKLKHKTVVKYPESILKQVPTAQVPLWYITNLTYDPNPLRNRGGDRVRQDVTVELTEIVLAPSALQRVEQEHSANANKLRTFRVHEGINTIRKIAASLTKGR